MATINTTGRAEFGGKKFSGVTPGCSSLLHVFLLIGFRSRITVMRQRIWAYVTRAGEVP